MAISLVYQPDKGVFVGGTLLVWETDRRHVRTLLNDDFEVDNNTIELAYGKSGDISQSIIQRRDIYRNYQGQENFFFLNFDTNDQLSEVELHHGFDISIKGVIINFSMDVEEAAVLLDSISNDKKRLSDGEYFFRDLKLIVASGDAVGGDGNELSYFYCSKDVTHLVDKVPS